MQPLFRIALNTVVLAFAAVFTGHTAAAAVVPALLVTAPNGSTSIVIPTMHVPFEGLRQPSPSVLQGVKRYVIESSTSIGPQPEKESAWSALAPEVLPSMLTGKLSRAHWAEQLTSAEIEVLRANVKCNLGASDTDPAKFVDTMLAMKSSRGAAGLAWRPCAPTGLRSRDAILEQAARDLQVPIDVLETQIAVEARRREVPERIYVAQLYEAFSDASRESIRRTAEALNAGDFEAIARLMDSDGSKDPDDALFWQIMTIKRNNAWLPSLTQFLDEGHAVITVGAAHISGPGSVVDLLSQRGYVFKRVDLPEEQAQ